MFRLEVSIKTGLQLRGLKQYELAANIGVTTPYMSWLCNGKSCTSMKTAEKMATVFGVSLSEFISWGEE